MRLWPILCSALLAIVLLGSANATVMEYGDEDMLGTGVYGCDPKAGATLEGLTADEVTLANQYFNHSFPFRPNTSDYAGTDQIYVGSTQTGYHDGYSNYDGRINGPQVISIDYDNLVQAGYGIDTFTLGIAADDFQHPVWGNTFMASINGEYNSVLTDTLNSLNQTYPKVQFLTIGIDPRKLSADNKLTLTIDQNLDGGDGWAIDYLTVGITSSPVPEPSSMLALGIGATTLIPFMRRRRK